MKYRNNVCLFRMINVHLSPIGTLCSVLITRNLENICVPSLVRVGTENARNKMKPGLCNMSC